MHLYTAFKILALVFWGCYVVRRLVLKLQGTWLDWMLFFTATALVLVVTVVEIRRYRHAMRQRMKRMG